MDTENIITCSTCGISVDECEAIKGNDGLFYCCDCIDGEVDSDEDLECEDSDGDSVEDENWDEITKD